jgi:imidazolonepropionase-like amidohydrolase
MQLILNPLLGLGGKIGSIEVGKIADPPVNDGDVSKHIKSVRRIVWVFKQAVPLIP